MLNGRLHHRHPEAQDALGGPAGIALGSKADRIDAVAHDVRQCRTVGFHLRSVYRKLGVPSRAAAAREAARRFLI